VSNSVANLGVLTATNGTLTLVTTPVNNASSTSRARAPGTLSVTRDWRTARPSTSRPGSSQWRDADQSRQRHGHNLGAVNTLLVNQGRVVLGGSTIIFNRARPAAA